METLDKIKQSYNVLLNSGMFFEFYPELTGVWEDDKDFWYEEYHERMSQLENR